MSNLTFSDLRLANVQRCGEVFHPLDTWSPSDWACAMAGECGEACNAVKKLRRHAEGTNTAKDPATEDAIKRNIAAELADTVIYADLLAARLGIDLGAEVVRKFNVVSERMSSSVRLDPVSSHQITLTDDERDFIACDKRFRRAAGPSVGS